MDNRQINPQSTTTYQSPNPEGTTSLANNSPAGALLAPVSLPSPMNLPNTPYDVFISHAGEDKVTIAFPLREKLRERGITAFVDKKDMTVGMDATSAMIHAMHTARVGVFVMSPEFVARKWPMKELMHFLSRRETCMVAGHESPTLVPFFYRLAISDLYDEPRLDRNDNQGNSLYEMSRFYERQRKGEPEANIAAIKAALKKLHGIMGVENMNNANNETSHRMYLNREMLLNMLCDSIFEALPKLAVQRAVTQDAWHAERDTFRPHFDIPYDVSELVFDFNSKDSDGNVCTQEGKILQMLLNNSVNEHRAIAVRGIGGVGKTSLLRKLRSLNRVLERFKDGVYSLEVGRDATQKGLKKALISAVSNSGGIHTVKNMDSETDIRKVMEAFRKWFENKQCLFVIDDVWETKEVTRGTICDLWTLHTSGRDSKTLLATRSTEIAAEGKTYFRLEPRETLGNESRAILYHYARLKPEARQVEDNRVVDEILKRCAGLPLFLGVAGKGVKTLSLRRNHKGCMAYRRYANQLKTRMSDMVTTGVGSHIGLLAGLKISIHLIEERREGFEFDVNVSMAEMHRRLSVVKKQMQVPMSMLKQLWEVENESQAAWIAKEFEQVGLADVEYEEREHGEVEVLRLHDSVYDFASYETKAWKEEELGHKVVLEGYANALQSSNSTERKWWSEDLQDDKYIHGNLCRHLVGAGLEEELFGLLFTSKWLDRQVDLNGIGIAREDFSFGIQAAWTWKEKAGDGEHDEMEEALEMIAEAITLSSSYILKNRKDLWFQVHGRLKRAGACNELVREYLKKIESDAPKPGLFCMNGLLVEAGGANARIISVGSAVWCMALIDGERVACGCSNGVIAIVNVRRSEVESRWRAHDSPVRAIDVGNNGTRIVSGSSDKTAKVWNTQSGEHFATFYGHESSVECVAISKDGKQVISASIDRTVQVWDTECGQRVSTPIYTNFKVWCLAMFRDGERVVVGGGLDGELEMWDVTTNAKVAAPFDGHPNTVRCGALSADERRLVTGCEDSRVRLWDVETRQQIGDSFEGHTDWVRCVATSDDGRHILSASSDKTIRIWDIGNGEQVCESLIGHTGRITGVSFLAEDDMIVSCSQDRTVRVWNFTRKRKETAFDRNRDSVRSVSFTPDGKFVVCGSRDRTIEVWDAISGQAVGEPMRNPSRVYGVAVTPDGQFVVSVSGDKRVRLWDLQSREVVRTFGRHARRGVCVAVTPDGERAVTGSKDRTVRIWNIKSTAGGQVVLNGHNATVERVFVSDDGKRIFSVDADNKIFVWDIETRTKMKTTAKRDARRMSRRQILGLTGEATVHDEACLSILRKTHEIVYGEGNEARVLGTLESNVIDWDISPDNQTICIGLYDRRLGFLKLHQ